MPTIYDHVTAERITLRVAQLERRACDAGRIAAVVALRDAMQTAGAWTVGELPDGTRNQHADAIADVGSPQLQWRWQKVPPRARAF